MGNLEQGMTDGNTIRTSLMEVLQAQRSAFLREMPVSLKTRQDRLDRGLAMLLAHREALHAAVMQDFSVRGADWALLAEIAAPVQVFQQVRKGVEGWMRPERRKAPIPFSLFGAKAEIQYQPLGVVGIMGAWNGAINLVLVPLATALAAGNRAMLCPSDMMPNTAQALAAAVCGYFDTSEVAVAQGGLEVCKAFSSLPFDHLLFTGSPGVGAQVMAAAAPNLTPVTLELGGKCPVIVTPDADLADTAKSIIATKTMNGGQACLAPDLLLVSRDRQDALLEELDRAAAELYPGAARHPEYCGIVNERNYTRITSLVDQARAAGSRIKVLGLSGDVTAERDDAQRRMALHVVVDPPAQTRAMTEEVFGPVLTMIGYDNLEQACAQLREMPKPLGLYVFSQSRKAAQFVLDRSFSGGVTLNDAMFHYSVPDLPFGGVGRSGMGSYSFGIEGFKRFSHARSVYTQAGPRSLMRVMQPPYGKLFDLAIRKRLERLAGERRKPSR